MTQEITTLPNVYFLTGDDTVGRERFRQSAMDKIKGVHKQFTLQRFDHTDGDFNLFIQDMLTQSLFQDTRIFSIGHAEQLSAKDLKQLDKIVKAPPSDIFLFIEVGVEKKSKEGESNAMKALQAEKRSTKSPNVYVFKEFPRPSDYKVGQWLMTQVPVLLGRSISKNDADYFIDLAGNDIDLLHSELQKIDIHLEPGAPVTHDVIERIVGPSRQMTVFELSSALGACNFARALTIIDSLFSTTFAPPAMVSALFRHFWALLRIRKFAAGNPGVMNAYTKSKGFNNPAQNEAALAIGQAAGLLGAGDIRKVYPVIIASGIINQSQKFTDDELRQIIEWLLEYDFGIKTGRVDPSQQEVQLLCYRIVRVSELIKNRTAA